MTLSVWLSFALLAAAQTASPGPVVSLLISNGLRNGARSTLAILPGLFFGDLLLIVAAFAMTTALVTISEGLFDVVKIVGGSYLIYLGLKTVTSCRTALAGYGEPTPALKKSLHQGFVTTILNPKGILFFATLLPQFISPNAPYSGQFALLGLTYLTIGLMTDTFYAVGSSYGGRLLTPQIRAGLVLVAGTSLALTGVFVLFDFFRSN